MKLCDAPPRRLAAPDRRSARGHDLPAGDRAALTPDARDAARYRLARRQALCVRARAGATLLRRHAFALRRRPQSRSVRRGALSRRRQHRAVSDAHVRQRGRSTRDGGPGRARNRARGARIFRSLSRAARAEIERVRARHGHAILLDGHSIRARSAAFFAGRLPDLNLGTADGASCVPSLQAVAVVIAGAAGFTQRRQRSLQGRIHDAPVRRPGARRPRAAARNGAGVLHGRGAALSLGCAARAAPLVAVLERLVVSLVGWRTAG